MLEGKPVWNRLRIEDWLAHERRLAVDRRNFALGFLICGVVGLGGLVIVQMVRHYKLSSFFLVIYLFAAVGVAYMLEQFVSERRYVDAIDAFYLESKYAYEKKKKEKGLRGGWLGRLRKDK